MPSPPANSMRCTPRRSRAFTLLETLTAMVMMAVLALSIYSTLHIAFNARESAEAALAPVRILALSLDMLSDELRTVTPVTGMFALEFIGTDERDGQGDSDTLLFYNTTAYAPWPEHEAGFRETQLLLSEDPFTGERLLVRRTRDKPMAPIKADPDELVICRNVRSFNVRYYDGSSWVDAWDSTAEEDVAPYAVELTLEIEPLEERDATDSDEGHRMTAIVKLPTGGARPTEAQEGGQITR